VGNKEDGGVEKKFCSNQKIKILIKKEKMKE
jgi:hypothetical protein